MKVTSVNQDEKKLAGESAASLIKDGMVVGLGTGSTLSWTIKKLSRRIKEEGLEFLGVATSYQTEELAIISGISLTTLRQHPVLDLAIDGADQINPELFAIKGGGAAHTREKIVACSSKKFVVAVDHSKYKKRLDHPIPIEVLPFALKLVENKLRLLGGDPVLRQARMKDGPVISDNGNFVIDVDFGIIEDPRALATKLSVLPGLVGHGIFDNVDELHLGHAKKVEIFKR